MRIEWAEPAEWDFDDIYAFIARDVLAYARTISELSARISQFSGRLIKIPFQYLHLQ
jgi:plasmid stabilization system protein ParE